MCAYSDRQWKTTLKHNLLWDSSIAFQSMLFSIKLNANSLFSITDVYTIQSVVWQIFSQHLVNRKKSWYISCEFRHIMTDMVVGFPFAPKQYRANYVCLEMRGGFFFFITICESLLLNRISLIWYMNEEWGGDLGSKGERKKERRKIEIGRERETEKRENGRWLTNLYQRMYTCKKRFCSHSHTHTHTHENSSQMRVLVCVLSISFALFHQDLMRNIYDVLFKRLVPQSPVNFDAHFSGDFSFVHIYSE